MIRLLLYAALTISADVPTSGPIVPVSGRPFIVTWTVRWKPPLAATNHARRFSTADEAVLFEASAPLCSSRPAPCVEKIHASVVVPPRIRSKRKNRRHPAALVQPL